MLRTLNEIRYFICENPDAELLKTFMLGLAEGEGIFARPRFSTAAEFHSSGVGAPSKLFPNRFFTPTDNNWKDKSQSIVQIDIQLVVSVYRFECFDDEKVIKNNGD